jgi:arginase family enzyme
MVQIALRDSYAEFSALPPQTGITVLSMEECQRIGIPEVIATTRRVIGEGPVYVSFDIDALDPAFAPGTGTPVCGGLSTREALQLLRGLRGLDVIGGDIVEISPPYDSGGITALAGAFLLFELLCLAAEAHRGR